MRRLHHLIRAPLCAVLFLGCSGGTEPSDTLGAIRAEVTLLGGSAGQATSGELRLYSSVAGFEDEAAVRGAALAGGPDAWQGTIADVAAGTYYLKACFNFGCGEYRTSAGAPRPVTVTAGRTTEVSATF